MEVLFIVGYVTTKADIDRTNKSSISTYGVEYGDVFVAL